MIPPRVMLAVVALLLALGLPWAVFNDPAYYIPGWFVPSFCTYDYDGWMTCTPSYFTAGYTVGGFSFTYSGYETSARFTILIALLLVAHWHRNGGAWQLPVAALLQVGAVMLSGIAMQSGAVAALIASALLLVESGHLRMPDRMSDGVPLPTPFGSPVPR